MTTTTNYRRFCWIWGRVWTREWWIWRGQGRLEWGRGKKKTCFRSRFPKRSKEHITTMTLVLIRSWGNWVRRVKGKSEGSRTILGISEEVGLFQMALISGSRCQKTIPLREREMGRGKERCARSLQSRWLQCLARNLLTARLGMNQPVSPIKSP